MAFEEIRTIKDTEKEAEEILSEARKKALQMIKDGKAKADAIIQETQSEGEEVNRDMVEKATKSCEKEVGKLKEEYQTKWKSMEKAAMENMDKAVEYIMERIVAQNGNS